MGTTGQPTPPIAFGGPATDVRAHLSAPAVTVDGEVLRRLRSACADVTVDAATVAEASRDWWPVAMIWALDGQVAAHPAAVARPGSTGEVAEVLRVCNDARVPVTAAAGRSGVCGASVPVHGGVVLDLCALSGIVDVDSESLVLDVLPGTFGTWLEDTLRGEHDATLGHWPQSIDLSTVGGWLACRSAGQYSTRYGKIEDMVVGLDVALANGRVVHTGGAPRAAVGPDLTQLFVGSEGTLGVITGARLRLHPAPRIEQRAAFGFGSFGDGIEACRRLLHRGATPAVLRLYDAAEADRSYQTGDRHVLLALDEGDNELVEGVMNVVLEECVDAGAERLDDELVGRWLEHRNDAAALEALISRGFVVDTMEVAARWRDLPKMYAEATQAIQAVDGTLAASAHLSHSYPDGACLYFTFAGQIEPDGREAYYRAAWDAGTRAVLAAGGALSHHHGVGLNRARFVREALGEAFDVLAAVKTALDPHGILNPGKLALPDRRLGPRYGRAGRARAGLAGPAHGRALPRAARPRPTAGAERVGDQARVAARPDRPGAAWRPVLRHRRHLGGVDLVRRGAARDRRDQRRRHRSPRRRRVRLVGGGARSAAHPGVDASDHRRLVGDRGRGDGTARRTAHRRDRGRPAGVAPRARMCALRRRHDHLRHRRDA